VAGRLRAATGQVANGGPALPHGEWEFGFAAGLTAASPVGPLVLEYGFAIDGPDRVMVRVGEWF
jgi:hypothetical protein